MNIQVKGKLKETVSVQIDDILPAIKEAVLKEMGLPDDAKLHCISNTRYLLFNVIRNDAQLGKCNCFDCIMRRSNGV